MKTPCEFSMWYVVPLIRSRITQYMVNELGMQQSHVAKKLDLTDAAVSQYLSGRRAKTEPIEEWLSEHIGDVATTIAETEDKKVISEEICRVCRIIQASDYREKIEREMCCTPE